VYARRRIRFDKKNEKKRMEAADFTEGEDCAEKAGRVGQQRIATIDYF
jgi:hypothetical protein